MALPARVPQKPNPAQTLATEVFSMLKKAIEDQFSPITVQVQNHEVRLKTVEERLSHEGFTRSQGRMVQRAVAKILRWLRLTPAGVLLVDLREGVSTMRCSGCGKVPAACKCPRTPEERRRRTRAIFASGTLTAQNGIELADARREERIIMADSAKRDRAARNRERFQGVRKRK